MLNVKMFNVRKGLFLFCCFTLKEARFLMCEFLFFVVPLCSQ